MYDVYCCTGMYPVAPVVYESVASSPTYKLAVSLKVRSSLRVSSCDCGVEINLFVSKQRIADPIRAKHQRQVPQEEKCEQ